MVRPPPVPHAPFLLPIPSQDDTFLRNICGMNSHSSAPSTPMHPVSQVDSVIFPHYESPNWGGERLTEVVTLRSLGREVHYIDQRLGGNISCGRPPNLRPCSPSEPAMLVHGAMCSQPPQPAMAAVQRAAKTCAEAASEEWAFQAQSAEANRKVLLPQQYAEARAGRSANTGPRARR